MSQASREFFQQSTQIQSEIQSLAEYCKGLTEYAQTSSHDQSQKSSFDSSLKIQEDDLVKRWVKINSLLEQYGFPQLELYYDESHQQVPDASAVADCVIELLVELNKRTRDLTEADKASRSLAKDFATISSENMKLQKYLSTAQDTQEQLRHLSAKHENLSSLYRAVKDKYHSLKRRSLRNSDVLRESVQSIDPMPNTKNFRQLMRRDIRENSQTDRQILKIISDFTEEVDKLNRELAESRASEKELNEKIRSLTMNESLNQSNWENERKHLLGEIAKLKEKGTDNQVQEICDKLELTSPSQLMKSIDTMQQILITLPSIEQFVKAVVQEVLPSSSSNQLEDVIPKIQAWRRETLRLNQLRSEICLALGVPTSASDSVLLADCKSFELFKRLFSVGPRDDTTTAVEQLYIFVHEVKDCVQKLREALRLSGDADTRQVLQSAYERLVRIR